jgi:cytosine permease
MTSLVEQEGKSIDGALGEEFEHEPVPMERRRSLASVAAVWFGFPMVLTQAVFGGIIVLNLGFIAGASAIILGNLILCLYVGGLSYIAGSTGLNFAMQGKKTFGTQGYVVACALLSTLVVGWYAFQIGLTGQTVSTSFGWNASLVIVIATVLYMGTTFLGIRALSIIGVIAAPFFIVMGLVGLSLAASDHGLTNIWTFAGSDHGMNFWGAVSLVVAGFADAGTMTADFTRWSRNGKEAVAASFTAFPIANAIAFLFGGVIVAAGSAVDPVKNGGDFMPLLTGHGWLLSALAILFVFINLGSVCAHCLYNGAVGYSHLLSSRMRLLTLILGVLGGIAAVAGVWSLFPAWLSLLGIFVPPIGVIIIMDQLIYSRAANLRDSVAYRPAAFIAWALGSGIAIAFHIWLPQYGEALVALVVSGVAYGLLGMSQPVVAPSAEAAE